MILHVGDVSPSFISPVRIVDERGTVWDWTSPGDLLVCGEDGVQVEAQLRHAEDDHDEGGGSAGELLHVGEHPGGVLHGGLLL